MTRGQRYIDGKCFVLYEALPFWGSAFDSDAQESIDRAVRAAKGCGRYQFVRVVKDARRGRAYVYVL